MFEPLPEPLRRAYLHAMGMPVWVSRDEPSPLNTAATSVALEEAMEEAPHEQTARETPPLRGARRVRDMLGAAAPQPQRKANATPPPGVREERSVRAAPAQRVELQIVACAGIVMVADAAVEEAKAASFLSSVAYALTGISDRPASTHFHWPPPGLQLDQSETRAAAVSRLSHIRDSGGLRLVLLMGDTAVESVLEPAAQQVLGCPALQTGALAELMASSAHKRALWAQLAGFVGH